MRCGQQRALLSASTNNNYLSLAGSQKCRGDGIEEGAGALGSPWMLQACNVVAAPGSSFQKHDKTHAAPASSAPVQSSSVSAAVHGGLGQPRWGHAATTHLRWLDACSTSETFSRGKSATPVWSQSRCQPATRQKVRQIRAMLIMSWSIQQGRAQSCYRHLQLGMNSRGPA